MNRLQHKLANKRRRAALTFGLLVLAVSLSVVYFGVGGGVATAESELVAAWRNVQIAGRYEFSADVTQKTIPLPSVTNVGRGSSQQRIYMEGSNQIQEETLQLAMWSNGGSVLQPDTAYQVEVIDGHTRTKIGNEPWRDSESVPSSFAPNGNPFSFLVAATDVTREPSSDPNQTHCL